MSNAVDAVVDVDVFEDDDGVGVSVNVELLLFKCWRAPLFAEPADELTEDDVPVVGMT